MVAAMNKKSSLQETVQTKSTSLNPLKVDVNATLTWLKENSSKKIRDDMLPRYGINARKSFGVSVANPHTGKAYRT